MLGDLPSFVVLCHPLQHTFTGPDAIANTITDPFSNTIANTVSDTIADAVSDDHFDSSCCLGLSHMCRLDAIHYASHVSNSMDSFTLALYFCVVFVLFHRSFSSVLLVILSHESSLSHHITSLQAAHTPTNTIPNEPPVRQRESQLRSIIDVLCAERQHVLLFLSYV